MSREKVALVSGDNRGLGLEICRQLAESGYRVYLASRDIHAGHEAVREIGSESVKAVKLDVTVQSDVDALVDYLQEDSGYLDVLINNAGIMIDSAMNRSASIRDADIEVVEQSFKVNTLAPIRLINAMLPLMARVDQARIVNISSGMGQLSDMGGQYPGYRLSKTALNAVTRIFAAELDPAKFLVNAVCPGWVRTDMGGEQADLSVEEGADTPVWLATSNEVTSTGGYYRQRKSIDW